MRALTSAVSPLMLGGAVLLSILCSAACTELPELEKTRSERGSLGEEVFKLVCRRLAGTELPNDLDGSESHAVCLGDAGARASALDGGQLPARLRALVERRAQIVQAVDATLPVEGEGESRRRLGNELEEFMRTLVGFYEPPEERIQNASRRIAGVLEALLESQEGEPNEQALLGLSRLAHEAMLPSGQSFALYRALMGHPRLPQLLSVLLPILAHDEEVSAGLRHVLAGLALELADLRVDDDPESDARLLRDLTTRRHPDFASGQSLWIAERDPRGMPAVALDLQGHVPAPFVDEDGDGLADLAAGRFVAAGAQGIPTPFSRLGGLPVMRDRAGRALREDGSLYYRYHDVDRTLLRAVGAEAGALFDPDSQIAVNLARIVPEVFGRRVDTQYRVGAAVLEGYQAPDVEDSPVLDLAHASSVMVDRPVFDQSLALLTRLLSDHEPTLARTLAPLLEVERAVRPDAPRYPDAGLTQDSIFWDELLFELAKVSRRRESGDGATTLLESLLRGLLGQFSDGRADDPRVRFQGAILSVMLRYKDEWRGDPRDPEAPAIGGFRELVDRSQPDMPVTCGRDGCGGTLAESRRFDFDDFVTTRNQKCVIPRPGQIGSDCGAPSNQSLLHRSVGLIQEMVGRSQCNRRLTIEELLAFADPACEGKADRLDENGNPGADGIPEGDLYDPPRGDDPCEVLDLSPSSEECQLRRQLERQQCEALKAQSEAEQADLVQQSRDALAEPAAMAKYVRPFETGPNPVVPSADGQLFPVEACELFDFDDVGRVFGQALTGDFVLDIPHPGLRRYLEDVARVVRDDVPLCEDLPVDWENPPANEPDCVPSAANLSRSVFEDLSDDVDTLDELIEFLSKVRGMTTRPSSRALTRVLFAAPGATALQVFDPLVIKGSPPACVASDGSDLRDSGTPACPADDSVGTVGGEDCCIADPVNPPLRYRVDTYYGNTSFAWDVPFTVRDPETGAQQTLTFTDALVPLAAAVNAHDFDPEQDAARAEEFEDTGYLLATIGASLGKHWDSAGNRLAQDEDPNAPHYRTLSGLVSWEEMLADALDDGSIVRARLDAWGEGQAEERIEEGPLPDLPRERQLGLMARAYELLSLLDGMQFDEGDGLDLLSELSEHMLNPHARCARTPAERGVVDGRGACHATDADADAVGRRPVAYRDGSNFVCYNDGTCFDRPGNYRYVAPVHLLVDALHDLEDRIEQSDRAYEALQKVRSGLFDTYLQVDEERARLRDRVLRALILVAGDFMRERWEAHRQRGDLRQWADELTQDSVDMVRHPVFAGSLQVLEGMLDEPEALEELNQFAHQLLADGGGDSFQALVAGLADVIQMLPGDEDTVALTRALSVAFARNGNSVVERGGHPQVEDSAVWRNLTLTADAVARDDEDVLARVLNNLVRPVDDQPGSPHALDLLVDAIAEVNRSEPGSDAVLDAGDWADVLHEVVDLLRDERRGLERVYRLVQCRESTADDPGCQ